MESSTPPPLPIDPIARDRRLELDIKEREVAAYEREVGAKEADQKKSAWLSPTVIGLFVAALGLIGSVIVAQVNNSSTQKVEQKRAQSTLILEAIKTGDQDAACRNLLFFVSLGLVEDENLAIQKQCAKVPAGIPTLPSPSSGTQDKLPNSQKKSGLLYGEVNEYSTPLEGVPGVQITVTDQSGANFRGTTDRNGLFSFKNVAGETACLNLKKKGYKPFSLDVSVGSYTAVPLSPNK